MIELVRAFVGYEFIWEVQLLIGRQDVQTAQLGGPQQLGWSTWLEQSDLQQRNAAVEGMVMEPEAYAQH